MRDTKDILDFIVIGAQKAGTTSLFEYLRRHPDIRLPPHKEAPYFSHDAVRSRGWDYYMKANFSSSDPTRKWGTITTHYMVGGVYDASLTPITVAALYDERTVPLRIREHLPDVRLVALLRDPVKRALSHHRMAVMNGDERRTFDEAIDELVRPESLAHSRKHPRETTGYVTWGEYGRILAGYLDVFPREQILILFSTDLECHPERVLRRVHEFIRVTPGIMPDNLGTRYREGGATRRFFAWSPYSLQASLTRSQGARALWHMMPESGRRWCDRQLAHVAYQTDLWNRRAGLEPTEPTEATVARLREHFEHDTDRLASLLGEMPPWRQPAGEI
jgi:hypothetical protein